MLGNADISGNAGQPRRVWFSRLRSGQRRSPQTQSGALVVSGGAGIQGNVNVGGNTIISGEVGASGDANVDGGMNVVGNADICGNVMLTPGTSLFSRFISGRRRRHPVQLRGVGGVWRSGNNGNVNGGYAGVVGDMDVSGSAVGRYECCRKRRYLRECAINFWVECGSAGSYQGNDGVNRHNWRWWWRWAG
jgi:hypothetical protein